MPEAAKLVAALMIAALACALSLLYMPLMPEGTDFGMFLPVNAALGAVVGWRAMGPRVGRGITAAINNGLGGAFLLVLWALLLHASAQMFKRAQDNWYSGLFDAFAGILGFVADYALLLLNGPLLVVFILGGTVAGIVTEVASRHWR